MYYYSFVKVEYNQYNPQYTSPNDDNAILVHSCIPVMEIVDDIDRLDCEALFVGEIYEYVEQRNLPDILTRCAETLERVGYYPSLAIVDVHNQHFSECGEYTPINQSPCWVRLDNGYS